MMGKVWHMFRFLSALVSPSQRFIFYERAYRLCIAWIETRCINSKDFSAELIKCIVHFLIYWFKFETKGWSISFPTPSLLHKWMLHSMEHSWRFQPSSQSPQECGYPSRSWANRSDWTDGWSWAGSEKTSSLIHWELIGGPPRGAK